MHSKHEISSLLQKKSLTGAEAGMLLLQDCVESDHQRETILTEKDKRAIVAALRTQADIQEYNRYVETWRLTAYSIQESLVLGYRLIHDIYRWLPDIQKFQVAGVLKECFAFGQPAIVTEKQYQDIKARQKEWKLKRREPLQAVLESRALHLASEAVRQECEEDAATVAERHPELLEQARREIARLRKSGKLKVSKGKVAVQQLYAAGLPEWVEWVELVETQFLKGEPSGNGYAIIQQPEPHLVDEKGYYAGVSPERITQLASSFIEQVSDIQNEKLEGMTLKDFLRFNNARIINGLTAWLAYKNVMELLSERLGVYIYEDLESCFRDIQAAVRRYNEAVTATTHGQKRPVLPDDLALLTLEIDKLKPDKNWVRHLKERMALGLGEDWWKQIAPEIDAAVRKHLLDTADTIGEEDGHGQKA